MAAVEPTQYRYRATANTHVVPGPLAAEIKPSVLLAIILAGAAATVGLWWIDTPPFHGVAEWLTNAGRITGLLAGYAIVVLLALMARVPIVERGLGADRLARWHSMGGRYTVSLIFAHALLIIWGYGLTDHHNVVVETGILWTQYADVLMATVAWGLFIFVGVTSARAARQRLRYETWQFIHFYTYLATALAFSHQFSTGADFVDNKPARVVWAAMYIVIALLLVRYRFLAPVIQSLRHDLRVEKVVQENNDVVSIWISGKNLQALQAESGQFFRWRFLQRGLWWSANPYSLSAAVHPHRMRITVKVLGDHSERTFYDLRIGTRIIAEGPYGSMTRARRSKRGVVLLAGGVGITPLRALFETLSSHGGDVVLIYRASRDEDVLFEPELERLSGRFGGRVFYAVGSRNGRMDVFAGNRLRQLLPDIRERDVYVCGPSGLMEAANGALRRANVPRRRVHKEDFSL